MSISRLDYESFVRHYDILMERARQLFAEKARHLNPELRHEIVKIDFDDSGCTIHYKSSHCSNCQPDVDEWHVSLDDLLEDEAERAEPAAVAPLDYGRLRG